jgi:hypothetical protein
MPLIIGSPIFQLRLNWKRIAVDGKRVLRFQCGSMTDSSISLNRFFETLMGVFGFVIILAAFLLVVATLGVLATDPFLWILK